MRPLLRIPTRLRLTPSLLFALTVVGLMMTGFVLPVGAMSEPTAELDRCDLDPRFGGLVANLVDHGFENAATVGHPIIGEDGLTYASFSELVFPGPGFPHGGTRLSVIRFGPDGKMDRAYGDNGFAHLPTSGTIASMGLVGEKIVALTSEFGEQHEASLIRLTESGALDTRFGTGGVLSLGIRGGAINLALVGVIGEEKTDIFSYDFESSLLTYLVVDQRGRIREVSQSEMWLGSLGGAYADPEGRVLLLASGSDGPPGEEDEETVEPLRTRSLGGGATILDVGRRPVGRDGSDVWVWESSFRVDPAGTLTSIGLDGVTVRSSAVSLGSGSSLLAGRVEAVLTLPSGQILVLVVDRSFEPGPLGTIYRFSNFDALSQGRFTKTELDLNKSESYPPPTELLIDATGGARVFSGAWPTSSAYVSQARILPHPVLVPQAGAMVDQMDRLYGAAFGREPDTAGRNYWLDQRANGLSALSIAALFAQSPEFRSTYNDPDQAGFVEILYGNVLNRHSDTEGLAYWTGRLTSGDLTRAQVLLAFSDSPEFVTKTDSLAPNESPWSAASRLYETAFARASDHEGFCYFVAELQDGRTLSWVAQQMVQSAEFANRHDGTDTGFVAALYRGSFDRQPGAGEFAYWVSQLEAGTPRGAILLSISHSPEAIRHLGY